MKINIRFIILLVLVIIVTGILYNWATNQRSFHTLYPELDLAFAFSTALQYNNPDAYDMIDPSLKSRLDDWMSVHQRLECKHPYDVFLIETGTNQGSKTIFGCYGYDRWISFEVDDIVIKDMKVVDWGEVREGD